MPYRRRAASCGVVALVFAAASVVAFAQAPPAGRETSSASVAGYALSQPMPVDPEVVVGTLPNGLRYYVRANGKPAHRAELRLVVKAGSVLEDDDQRGLAHFVEHMEFEGTRHFPKQGLDRFPRRRSASASARMRTRRPATTTRSTRCACRPTCPASSIARCSSSRTGRRARPSIRAASIASAASSSPNGGCISAPASGRRTRFAASQLEGSRYADRSPIGNPDIIEHAQREQLMRFYHDWYRPDLMAVIVVGDVDRDAVGGDDQGALLVADRSVARRGRGRPSTCPTTPARATRSSPTRRRPRRPCEISDLRPARNQGSVGGYRDIMRDQLFATCSATGSTSSARARTRRS